jgi:hypothetical protein
MTLDSFWRLFEILLPHIRTALSNFRDYECKGGRESGNYSLPPIRNGSISLSARLGAAIRYFAGGSPYDIVFMFGISYVEVMASVWIVVEAINAFPRFDIFYRWRNRDRLPPDFKQQVHLVFATVPGRLTGYSFGC